MIKEITAIIRTSKWAETLVKLEEIGVVGFTRQRIYGRGKQRGLRYGAEGEENRGISFLPKWMVTVVVEDSKVDVLLEALIKANRTGEIGDGKIFICSVTDSVRIRTNESEEFALN
ncbi:MAG TPA: P-II family nitrogen regulator [bacterium]|nr:P-II family nitrogen regulator [bacterium]